MNTNERILQAQLHDLSRQLHQAWMAIRNLSGGEDPHEVIERVRALVNATAWMVAKDGGLDSPEDAMEEAERLLGVGG